MATTTNAVRLRLSSQPYRNRVGLVPMLIALLIGFSFSCLWFAAAIWMLVHNGRQFLPWGVLIICATLAYCTYLFIAAQRIYADSKQRYVLELSGSEAILSIFDAHEHKSAQMVLLADVKYVEYYPYSDCASMILHAPYTDMEVPLWPFGAQAQDIIDFLEGRGLTVVNVQMDDRFPEAPK